MGYESQHINLTHVSFQAVIWAGPGTFKLGVKFVVFKLLLAVLPLSSFCTSVSVVGAIASAYQEQEAMVITNFNGTGVGFGMSLSRMSIVTTHFLVFFSIEKLVFAYHLESLFQVLALVVDLGSDGVLEVCFYSNILSICCIFSLLHRFCSIY